MHLCLAYRKEYILSNSISLYIITHSVSPANFYGFVRPHFTKEELGNGLVCIHYERCCFSKVFWGMFDEFTSEVVFFLHNLRNFC